MIALIRKELKIYFASPLTYLMTALFNTIIGWLFFNYLVVAKEDPARSLQEAVFSPFFGSLNFILLFIVPLLTMRTLAEERKEGTLDLLFNSRLTPWMIILGKFISAYLVTLFMISFTFIFPIILSFGNHTDWPVVLLSYLGIFCALSVYVWVGIFASSLTENQFIAAIITFATLFFLMLLALSGNLSGNELVIQILTYFAPGMHLGPFTYGFVKSYSILYFLSANLFFALLTESALFIKRS